MDAHNLHRRRSSKDEEENVVLVTRPMEVEIPSDELSVPIVSPPPIPRNRVVSSPVHAHHSRSFSSVNSGRLPTASPLRTGFNIQQQPPNGINLNGYPSSPFRSSFGVGPTSPTHSHSRTRSISAFAPSVNSPLSTSFPIPIPTPPTSATQFQTSVSSPTMYAFPSGSMSTSNSAPDSVGINNLNPSQPTSLAPPGSSTKRHTRLHSRNLSVFFPRPGSLPTASIAEDGSQEVEMPQEAPVASIPSAGLSVDIPSRRSRASHSLGAGPPTPLGVGFTFGARPPSSAASDSSFDTATSTQKTSRRGHHHKHSLSHSFFSFLEPGSTGVHPPLGAGLPGSGAGAGAGGRQEEILHTQPTPMPLSPWAPMSGFPQSAKMTGSSSGSFPPHTPVSENGFHNHQPFPEPDERDMGFADHVHGHMHGPASGHGHGHGHDEGREWQGDLKDQGPLMIGVGVVQFILGAWLWVSGQQIGSLSVTGLGYWIVFDAFGVGLKGAVMRWLDLDLRGQHGGVETKAEKERRLIRRPYGIAPVQTVLMFGQAVYLLFSSVYICKETFEHLLLSAGNVEGHHHHHGDEDEGLMGIEFPVILALITILSVFGTSIFYSNHARLVNVTNTRLPSLRSLIRSLSLSRPSSLQDPVPTTSLGLAFSNPFTLAPLVFAGLIITVAVGVPTEHHRICDLVLAGLITIVTFNLAYRACSVLGTTLLQTAPPRGMPGGKMEAFLRVMREIERHPQVLHLPAPHIWQLGPASSSTSSYDKQGMSDNSLVVTMELHVRHDLGDDEVLELTRWAWEKCAGALGWRREGSGGKGTRGPEVTVGVVRG